MVKWKWLRDYAGIGLGTVITALALNIFLIPNKVAAGGTSGLATVLHHTFGLPVGLTMLALDIPMFLLSLKILGARFGVNTLFGAGILAVSIDFTAPFVPVLTRDLLLNSIYGGVLAGVGMGIVFKFKGTTAGTDLAAAIINKLTGISIGQALLGVDFFVIALAGVVFGSAELSLYALISLFVTTKIIDLVQEGPSAAKAFFIMSSSSGEVADAIMAELGRGVTMLAGRGAYTKSERDVVFCVVSTREVSHIKDLVYRIDRQAFVIVADAHEVLGEGFSSPR
ncbi:YitT family protein [Sporomusa termitida]|uniref:Putative 5xTM membrane BCR, YitT family n=1 Tax=Sporomusa termitida TaxID=2377 RepID=A0A517DX42_9FIRM|nr:YitT family protein [Sporomusa termitida]QDR81922.1 putative 5xTM membrane BCR, YitT family [Sporomusa termitida]